MEATATYQLTQADIAAGHVANMATVSGQAPDGSPVSSDPASVDVVMPVADLPAVAG
jgi:hypothetical protein